MDFDGTYPTDQSICPPFPEAQYNVPPVKLAFPLLPTLKLGYWELLSPTLLGTTGALYLSFFSDNDHLPKRCGGTLFKLAIVCYAIGSSVAAFIAVIDILSNSSAPYDYPLRPVGVTFLLIILLFTSEYLLLYRFFPSSFQGDVGNNFWTQLFSFLYYSVTVMPGACRGDIVPDSLTARVLISTEMAFYLFTIATAMKLILL